MIEKFSQQPEISEGERYHKILLDSVDNKNPEYQKDLEKVKKPAGLNTNLPYYVNFKDSLDLVRRYQPPNADDPEGGRVKLNNPKKEFLNDLRWEIIEWLGLRSEKEQDKLLVYTAEESPLDHFHGTDFVVDFDGKIITIDITLQRERGGKRAGVIVTGEMPGPNDEERKEEYEKRVEELAKRIVKKFLQNKHNSTCPLAEKDKQELLE